MGKQLMGIKKGTCSDEYQVMNGNVESLLCATETNTTLYVSYLEFE